MSSQSKQYVDIAFPTSVRRLFTYEVRVDGAASVLPGMRVWVPLQGVFAIGMVVRVHDEKPSFPTRPVAQVLDSDPVMSKEMLKLTYWTHRFYFCGWGEVIQTALPVGLNFRSERRLRVDGDVAQALGTGVGKAESAGITGVDGSTGAGNPGNAGITGVDGSTRTGNPTLSLTNEERSLLLEIAETEPEEKEMQRRLRDQTAAGVLKRLMKRGLVSVWERPVQKIDHKQERFYLPGNGVDPEQVHRELLDQEKRYKWQDAFLGLVELGFPVRAADLTDDPLFTSFTLNRIEQEGWIRTEMRAVSSGFEISGDHAPERIKTLSADQQKAFEAIREALDSQAYRSFLLHGVTGSGKTEVYIHALRHALEQGRGGMVLVPEIALTPQTVRRFYEIFGDQIAVLHSRLSVRERFDAWHQLQSGQKRIVIGPRSAVFAPVQDLGILIVDEEHDKSYKQIEPAPRYHAREVALVRARLHDAVAVLGSATPAVGSMFAAGGGKHTLLPLPQRPTGTMPQVKVLNLKEYRGAMRGPLAVELYEQVREALSQREQIILLHNRRGFSSYLQCVQCGHIPQSPQCSVSLTYHKKRNMLLCHYSGYARRAETHCELCTTGLMQPQGLGTQQVEDEIAELFPEARLIRMDQDTTGGKHSHQTIYETFLRGDADILIGTQLVAKGLDFPNVTLVGVIQADTELAFPSFQAGERLFQLLSQVAGRAGRAEKPGRVLIQTWRPQHPAILAAAKHDYHTFANYELSQRQATVYPPFTRLVVFHFKSRSWSLVQAVADHFCNTMRMVANDIPVLGPAPSVLEWIQGWYQWEANIKLSSTMNALEIDRLLTRVFATYDTNKPKGASAVRIVVDVDAVE